MITTIEVNGLRLHAFHGVKPQERVVGNTFEVSVHLRYPFEESARNDTLHSTLNYTDIVNIIKRVMAQPSALLENVAWRIRKTLVESFPKIISGSIRVAKISPPVPAEVQDVAVKIEW